jgi:ribosome-binding factor A
MKILKDEQGRMQFLLNRKMNIKPMPRINFLLDEGLEKAAAIEKIFIAGDNQ